MKDMPDLNRLTAVLNVVAEMRDRISGLSLHGDIVVDLPGVMCLRVPVLIGAAPMIEVDTPVAVPDLPKTAAPPVPADVIGAVAPVPTLLRDAAGRILWTDALDRDLLARRANGCTTPEIAEAMGASVPAITARIERLSRKNAVPPPVSTRKRPWPAHSVTAKGVDLHAWTEAAIDELIALYQQDIPLTEIAAKMGRSGKSISVKLTRLRAAGRVTLRRVAAAVGGKASGRPKVARDNQPPVEARVLPAAEPKAEAAAEQKSEPKLARPAASVPPVAAMPDPAPAAPAPAPFQMPKGAGLLSVPLRGADYGRAPVRIMPGMTDRQKAEAVAAHIAGLWPDTAFSEADDLALCEVVLAGRGIGVAASMIGATEAEALARFNLIVGPMRHPDRRGLPIEAAAWVLPPLRARATEVAA